jgi:hypothetical protein
VANGITVVWCMIRGEPPGGRDAAGCRAGI